MHNTAAASFVPGSWGDGGTFTTVRTEAWGRMRVTSCFVSPGDAAWSPAPATRMEGWAVWLEATPPSPAVRVTVEASSFGPRPHRAEASGHFGRVETSRRGAGAMRRATSMGSRGHGLVELLVATVVAGIALAGAWAWLWSVAPPARSLGAEAQAVSAAAFALRAVTHDLQESGALLTPTACAPDQGLLLEHRHPEAAPETVTIVWDGSRQVLGARPRRHTWRTT